LGAAIAVFQAGMGDRDARRAGIVLGAVAAVPGALLLLAPRVRIGRTCRPVPMLVKSSSARPIIRPPLLATSELFVYTLS
ncbi:hypothetical protein, partial [Accumulibacter sp.]|uniref:hypothetical protein n=1 Tax=Accumulibacter sp. TaxID=2053492 RepID=UPI00261E2D93